MSGPAGAAPPTAMFGSGLEISGQWRQKAVQKSRALVQTYLLTSSVHPPSTAAGGSRSTKPRLRLPALVASVKVPCRRSSMARLSLSEPSLLIPNEKVLFDGFSRNCHPSVSPKRPQRPSPVSKPSALLLCSTCHQSGSGQQVQNCRPGYIHFSQPIQLSSKSRPVRRPSHNPALSTGMGDLRPLVIQDHNSSSRGEPLSVIGKPYLPSCSERTTVAAAVVGPARPQLHVFLPTEAEREEVDSESVDEGFMDELDNKTTCLSLQQETPTQFHTTDRQKHVNVLQLK